MGVSIEGDSSKVESAERISGDVHWDASDGLISGGVVGDFTSSMQPTPFFLDSQTYQLVK